MLAAEANSLVFVWAIAELVHGGKQRWKSAKVLKAAVAVQNRSRGILDLPERFQLDKPAIGERGKDESGWRRRVAVWAEWVGEQREEGAGRAQRQPLGALAQRKTVEAVAQGQPLGAVAKWQPVEALQPVAQA